MAEYGNLSLLQQARAPQGNAGASALGFMLSGGDSVRREQMLNQNQLSNARLQTQLMEWRQKQQAHVHQQALIHQLQDRGGPRNEMLAHILATQEHINPNEVAGWNEKEQGMGFRQNAMDVATSPTHDDNLMNRMLSVIEGKPQQLTRIEGDTVLNPMVTPDQQHLTTTDLGKAAIGEKGAQAESARTASLLHMAGVGATNALTENRKAELPFIGGQKTPKAFTQHEMAAALGGENGQPDPARFRQFQSLKANHPGLSDAQALEQFRNSYDDDPAAAAAQKVGPPAPVEPTLMDRVLGRDPNAPPRAVPALQDMAKDEPDVPGAPDEPEAAPTQTAINRKTGQRMGLVNGQWIPLK